MHFCRGSPQGSSRIFQIGRIGDRLVSQEGGGSGQFYVIPTRPKVDSMDFSIRGCTFVSHQSASALFDPRSTYFYVFSCSARWL